MNWTQLLLVLVVGLVATALVFFLAYGRENFWILIAGSADRGPQNIASFRRSSTANDALASTEGIRQDSEITLRRYNELPAFLIKRVSARIESVDPLARRVDDGRNPLQIRYVSYSPTLRFPNFIFAESIAMDGDQAGLLIYAGAQIGKTDFGANRSYIHRLLKDF